MLCKTRRYATSDISFSLSEETCILDIRKIPFRTLAIQKTELIGLMQIIDTSNWYQAVQRFPPQHDEPSIAQSGLRQFQRERGEACGA
jgi:hypothetical protein